MTDTRNRLIELSAAAEEWEKRCAMLLSARGGAQHARATKFLRGARITLARELVAAMAKESLRIHHGSVIDMLRDLERGRQFPGAGELLDITRDRITGPNGPHTEQRHAALHPRY